MSGAPDFLPSRVQLAAVQPYRIPQFERAGYLRLDINEHPGGAPAFVVEAVHAALDADTLATYPVYARWHEAAAAYFGVGADEVTCTAGGDEAIKAICEAHLLAGKSLLAVEPGYDMFKAWAQLYGNAQRGVALGADFALDEQAWLEALTPDVGLVAIVTPNNPTGTLFPRALIEETLRRVSCPVVVDETYGEFVGHSVADLLPANPHLFIIRSFSKVHGLAGLRAGAVLSQAQNIEALRRVLNPFNVNRAAIAASLAVLQRPDHTARHVAEIGVARRQFVRDLNALGIETGPAHANFVLAHVGAKAGLATERLAAEGILIRNRTGSHPRLEGWCRIAIGSPVQMRRCAGALRKVLAPAPTIETLLFDMDGPLVDVSQSYRRAIVWTAKSLLGRYGASPEAVDLVDDARVEALKRRGGLNNDWDCTAALIAGFGIAVGYDEVKEAFQSLYWGQEGDGLIEDEPFRVDAALRARIAARFGSAVVTGRPREEALFTLKRRGADDLWRTVVAMEDVAVQKPDPQGIHKALAALDASAATAAYLGDSVDDIGAAKAAGVLAVGVLPAGAQWSDGLCERLYEAGAYAVFASIEEAVAWLGA